MLISLKVSNFAIVQELSLPWSKGFTSITGETGAGKSISIDALMFCLGGRAESRMLRPNSKLATVAVVFDISSNHQAKSLIEEMGFDDYVECHIRRTLNDSGKTKCFVNGHVVSVSQLKVLGKTLVSIHGQHAHQLLIKSQYQRQLIDQYADHKELLSTIKTQHSALSLLEKELSELELSENERQTRKQLLAYQVHELDEFSPQNSEYEALDIEQVKLANSSSLISYSKSAVNGLIDAEDVNVLSLLNTIKKNIENITNNDNAATHLFTAVESAYIDLEELSREIRYYSESIDLDPQKLSEVEERIGEYLDLSRKHNTKPNVLHETHKKLAEELSEIETASNAISQIQIHIKAVRLELISHCETLSKQRQAASSKLSLEIEVLMQKLSMENGKFQINISADDENIREHGYDDIEILVSTNPGQPAGPIGKIASGGELSRISLSVQVIMAEKFITPTLVFDEVDVGISGGTAAIVGKMIKKLGNSTQVISITHLPQVASFAHQHYMVRKEQSDKNTFASMIPLDDVSRVTEIARLVGGENITKESIENAKKLISEGKV